MGAGRGKTRRAQAVVILSGLKKVIFDEEKWNEFLKTSKLTDVKLSQYYLRGVSCRTGVEYEKVFNELFADAVAVNAIVLPDGYASADFVFTIRDKNGLINNAPRTSEYFIHVHLKNEPGRDKQLGVYLSKLNIPLFSSSSNTILDEMAHQVATILR